MKKRPILLIAMVIVISACGGGGGGGGGGDGSGGGGLATGGFTKTVGLGSAFDWDGPFVAGEWRQQGLYLEGDIGGSGYIESISLKLNSDEAESICTDVTVKIGHSTLTVLTTTFASNIEQGAGSLETVRTGGFTVPAGLVGDYFTIPLDQPFLYNGTDNLVVEFLVTSCSSDITLAREAATADRSLWNVSLGNPTGTALPSTLQTKFNIVGGDNELDFGGVSGSLSPFTTQTPRTQNLYLGSEIDGSGPITGLGFQMHEVSVAGSFTATIMMGHSTLAALGTTYADNYSDTPAVVANEVTFNLPAGIPAGEWFWVPLPDSTFNYNGTDNLIVDVAVSAGTIDSRLRSTTIANRRVWASDHTTTTGIVDDTVIHTKFRFNGGSMGIITGGTNSNTWPFNSTVSPKQQFLYQATELGTGGTITSVACRMNSLTSTATDHSNFEVVLGHTDLSALTTTFADNMQDATTVFSELFTVPGGLNQGDWIEIPLTTPFAYDGSRNLVVQYGSDASGTITHTCRYLFDDPRFPSRRAVNSDRLALVAENVSDTLFDLKLEFTK